MRIFLITGPRATGKTTFCERLRLAAEAQRFDCCGCLEISTRGTDDRPYRIELFDITSGNSWLAAQRPRDSSAPFEFIPTSFSRIRESCGAALDRDVLHNYDPSHRNKESAIPSSGCNAETASRGRICIIDEIGPLELEEHRGHAELLGYILKSRRADALVLTVRPSLVEALKMHISDYGSFETDIKTLYSINKEFINSTNATTTLIDAVLRDVARA